MLRHYVVKTAITQLNQEFKKEIKATNEERAIDLFRELIMMALEDIGICPDDAEEIANNTECRCNEADNRK